MTLIPDDPTKAQAWLRGVGTPDMELDLYIPRGNKGDPGGWVMGTDLGTTDLNAIVTAGQYRQPGTTNATLANNYPLAGANGFLDVYVLATGSVVQRFQPFGAQAENVQGFYQRRLNGGSWGPWAHYSKNRIDSTAGRALYVWDEVNAREQLVYGDTGARGIGDILLNGWTANTAAEVTVRRQGSVVTLNAKMGANVATNDLFFTLPTGWRPRTQDQHVISGAHSSGAYKYARARWDGNLYVDYTTTGTVYVGGAWNTTDAWPTTLPGSAVGTIPNL